MCSIQEEEVVFPVKRDISGSNRQCTKCKQNLAIISIRVDVALCQECFCTGATHKFRACFGKSKVVRDKETVLVAYSGGPSSCAMIHLIQEGLSKRAHKKLRFTPTLLYIHEHCTLKQSEELNHQNLMDVVHKMQQKEAPYCVYYLEQVLCETSESACGSSIKTLTPVVTGCGVSDVAEQLQNLHVTPVYQKEADNLRKLLSSAKSLTAKESLVHQLRKKLCMQAARCHGVSKVLLGDTSTHLAISLLSDITQGCGAHLPFTQGFQDKTYTDIIFLRPMREFLTKEVAIYNTVYKLEPCTIPSQATATGLSASLDRLTETFINGLQAEYPTTVSNVLRTGEKLELMTSEADYPSLCCLCERPLDTDTKLCSALAATIFSKSVSGHHVDRVMANQSACSSTSANESSSCSVNPVCCGEGDGSCKSSASASLTVAAVERGLCYGCRLTIRDMDDIRALPAWVLDGVKRQQAREQMKESIQEFLIDGDS